MSIEKKRRCTTPVTIIAWIPVLVQRFLEKLAAGGVLSLYIINRYLRTK